MSQHMATAQRLAKAIKVAIITEDEAVERLIKDGMQPNDAKHAIQAALQS